MKGRFSYFFYILLIFLFSCKQKELEIQGEIRIAFMSDVHLHDIFGTFAGSEFKGVKNPTTGAFQTIRTMESQLHSTRLFNENYFAFLAALDDAVKKGIKIIALPGDFSDDGQPMNVKALQKILERFSTQYDITFLVITGNHDPVRPFEQEGGKMDFMGEGGQNQPVLSKDAKFKETGLKPIITQAVKEMGYKGILNQLSSFGFYPQQKYAYWETPFSTYGYDDYTFEKAVNISQLDFRRYRISDELLIPDVSYLVEPQEGVWMLAIDANVYVPVKGADSISENPKNYKGASIGYNNVLTHKKHLLKWISKLTKEAKKRKKTLIAFSHYPMVEFNDGTSEMKKELFGESKMQLHRVPEKEVANAFADAGLKIHFGGHMHINDTGIHTTDSGNTLINVQTPSLAAYPSAYKIVTISSETKLKVETVTMDSVPRYDELFPLYEQEHAFLSHNESKDTWNNEILTTTTYKDYIDWHIKELVRLRFIPKDWPNSLRELLLNHTGKELLELAFDLEKPSKLQSSLNSFDLSLNDFEVWNGSDMILDFYRLHNGDELATQDMGEQRIQQYKVVLGQLSRTSNTRVGSELRNFARIFEKQFNGAPSVNFDIDLGTGKVRTNL